MTNVTLGQMRTGVRTGIAPMVILYITLFMFSMVHIETYIKSLLIVVKTISEQIADNA